jgi:acetate kinase
MDVILVINAGSSSIKFSIFSLSKLELINHGEIEDIPEKPFFSVYDAAHVLIDQKKISKAGYEAALHTFFEWLENCSGQLLLKAVGHRIVHGGKDYFEPIRVTDEALKKLSALIPLAPLHQPHNLKAIEISQQLYPKLLQVLCFDTAFHRTQDPLVTLFAIPRKMITEGIIRYGFHGLSYEYIASILPNYLGHKADNKIIVAHLGHGASMCAMVQRKSVATTMSFTALDGLVMGSRCGSIDPGIILYLLQEKNFTASQIEELLYKKCGLLGVSEISSDVRELTKSPDPRAMEAIDLFCYRAAREIGSLCAAMQGGDVIIFTAGIGENSVIVRKKICEQIQWLGVQLDDDANKRNDIFISQKTSRVDVLIIPTNEELMIAKHTQSFLEQ